MKKLILAAVATLALGVATQAQETVRIATEGA
jgi:polar amino acid transport system substrate-binding protein